jgi:hypothetical protein
MIRKNKKAARSAVIFAPLAVFLFVFAGCGGSTNHSVDTGADGDLYAVRLRPAPGTVGVSPRASFELSWTSDDPPPATFDVELVRYREGDEEDGPSENAEFSRLTRRGDSFTWDLDIADASGLDTDLDEGGVYFVRLRAGADEIEVVYVVAWDRSRAAARVAPPGGTLNGPGAARRHTVLLR